MVKLPIINDSRSIKSITGLIMERIDPDLQVLCEWITSSNPKDFERGINVLLSLSGLRSIHVGDEYEQATMKSRRDRYAKTSVAIDLIVLSQDIEDVMVGQCSTDWNDKKVTDILNISHELENMLSTKYEVILHPAIFTRVSRARIQESEKDAINRGARIFTSDDINKIFLEVIENGIQFRSLKQLLEFR